MTNTDAVRRLSVSSTTLLLALALFKLLLHFFTNGQYGYFRDEFYYMACGQHLDWGYVDHPPLIAFITAFTRWILGDSLFALRFFPALSGAILVFLTGLFVRELGGDLYAQALAALAVIIAPVYLLTHTLLTMNAFEPLFWTLAAYLLLLSIKKDNPRYWIGIGLVVGIGLMNKHSMAFFVLALVAALLLTPRRKVLLSKWPWLAGILALIIFLPNLLWQFKNDFATLEFLRNAEMQKNLPVSPLEFLKQQILLLHPLLFPLWLLGLYYYLFSREGRPYRPLGWGYSLLFLLFIGMRAKAYYLAPAYPILFASGAVAVENFLRAVNWGQLRPAVITLVLAGGIALAPMGLPVLPVEAYIKYAEFLGAAPPRMERSKLGKLPQVYADMFGWEHMVTEVARVYNNLSPEEKAKAAIFSSNYGEAGAIEFFGARYGLPKAISGHNSYWLWGPRREDIEIVITVGERLEDVKESFHDVQLAAIIVSDYVMPYENNLPVCIGRGMKRSLKEIWRAAKKFI